MGVVAAKAAMERAGIRPEQVEETIFGNARQAGGGPNPARQISIRSGVPQEVPAFTVNKACASGLKSTALAYQAIDRKSTRLNSSHQIISYAVFCLKKKKKTRQSGSKSRGKSVPISN